MEEAEKIVRLHLELEESMARTARERGYATAAEHAYGVQVLREVLESFSEKRPKRKP